MSELINVHDHRTAIRMQLLATASAIVLASYIATTNATMAQDTDRPTVWIELGGQAELAQGFSSPFTAPFMFKTPTPGPYQGNILIDGQKPASFAFGFEGTISFQPDDSDWVFSAGIRYGRSSVNRHTHQQSPVSTHLFVRPAAAYADITARNTQDHAILDFTVGKDVGLGIVGPDGTSIIRAGVRFAQFSEKSNANVYARPSVVPVPYPRFGRINYYPSFNGYSMIAHAQRSFHGIGPSLSWEASAAILGNPQDGELTLNWGVNGAVLFGRQRAKLNHTTHAYHLPGSYYGYYYFQSLYRRPHPVSRSRSVVVPNLGGFAGFSVKYPNGKVSFGYRADFFFGAMDAGIDTLRTKDTGFNGPFATVSIGLGG